MLLDRTERMDEELIVRGFGNSLMELEILENPTGRRFKRSANHVEALLQQIQIVLGSALRRQKGGLALQEIPKIVTIFNLGNTANAPELVGLGK